MKRILAGVAGLILLVGLFSFTLLNDHQFEITKNLNIFATLYRELNQHYVDELPTEELITDGIDAMLHSLDPYTDFIPESELENYRTSTTGEYGGIGAVVGKKEGISTVLMPYIGFPAYKAGLQIGDQITQIDGKNLEGVSSDDISNSLKGQPGTKVILTVKKLGKEETISVPITRDKIVISNVAFHGMYDNEVGYIRLSDFTTNAGKEVTQTLNDLKGKGAKSIILDLRENPGGLLDEAIKVANVFVPVGKEIVSTKGKVSTWDKTYNAPGAATDEKIPLVVLTSRGTASAAEIVSGVMQDYDRGVLIGTRTYGKGLVQATRPLPYNNQLKVTTAKYYIPSGRCIQAIDYSIRNKDGSVREIPDSLKVAFKTSKGRVVYDGGGITPDINVEPEELSHLLFNIVNNNFMFDYGHIYFLNHKEIAPAKDFKLTDAEYAEFVKWISSKELSFSSQIDEAIERLETMAKDERYYEGIEGSVDRLKTKVKSIKSNYLTQYQNEVRMMLEQEIVSRYYFHEGMVASAIRQDPAVLKAVQVLKNQPQYKKILGR